MNEQDKRIFTVIIAGRKQKKALLSALMEEGVHVINTIYGHGTVKDSYVESILGLVHEQNKTVITTLAKKETTTAVLRMLKEKFHFDNPNTGIAFTIPVDKVSF